LFLVCISFRQAFRAVVSYNSMPMSGRHIAFCSFVFMMRTSSAMSLGAVGKTEIKQHIQNAQLLQAQITPDGSMTESAKIGIGRESRAHRISGLVNGPGPSPPPQNINLGGPRHDNGGSYRGKNRPEFLKSTVCSDTACTECYSRIGCWYGSKWGSGNGFMKVDVPSNSQPASYVTEVWARCGDGGGQWSVTPYKQKNGIVEVFVNGAQAEGFPKSTFDDWPNVEKKRKDGTMKKKMLEIPISGDARIRISLRPSDTSQKASAVLLMMANGVEASVDSCMSVKDGLSVLGDASEAAFELRNVNARQLTCLKGDFGAMSEPLAKKCKKWRKSISKKERKLLLAFLSAALKGASTGMTEVRSRQHLRPALNASRTTRESCSDPAVDDPESWDCECLQSMKQTCEAEHSHLSLEDCLRTFMCNNVGVCEEWKEEHCEGSLVRGSAFQSMEATSGEDFASVVRSSAVAKRGHSEDFAIQQRATVLSTKVAAVNALGAVALLEERSQVTLGTGKQESILRRGQSNSTAAAKLDATLSGKCSV